MAARRKARKPTLSTVVSVRLTLSTGPELFAAVHSAPSTSERLKQLARLGLAAERAGLSLEGLAGPSVAVVDRPALPRPVAVPSMPKPAPTSRVPVPTDPPASPSSDAELSAGLLGASAFGFG